MNCFKSLLFFYKHFTVKQISLKFKFLINFRIILWIAVCIWVVFFYCWPILCKSQVFLAFLIWSHFGIRGYILSNFGCEKSHKSCISIISRTVWHSFSISLFVNTISRIHNIYISTFVQAFLYSWLSVPCTI